MMMMMMIVIQVVVVMVMVHKKYNNNTVTIKGALVEFMKSLYIYFVTKAPILNVFLKLSL